MWVSCFAHSSTLKIDATCSSEMSSDFQYTTRHTILYDSFFHKSGSNFVPGGHYANSFLESLSQIKLSCTLVPSSRCPLFTKWPSCAILCSNICQGCHLNISETFSINFQPHLSSLYRLHMRNTSNLSTSTSFKFTLSLHFIR
jgi:hypothetical protein